MDLLIDQLIKRTFKRREYVHIGRFYQSAGLLGIQKHNAKNLLSKCIKAGKIRKKDRWFLELRW